MSEEFTLDAYAKEAKKAEPKKEKKPLDKTKRISKDKPNKKSAIRRTGGSNSNTQSSNKKQQRSNGNNNSNNNNNNSNKNNRSVVAAAKQPKVRTVRPIPEHKRRIVRVFNLVPSINNSEFYNLFVKYGTIEESKIETDKKGKSEEKGYIIYRENEAAKRAIDDLHGVELEGRVITVEFLKDGERLPGREPAPKESSGVIHKTIRKDDRHSSNKSHRNDRNNNNNHNNHNNNNNNKNRNNKNNDRRGNKNDRSRNHRK